MYLCVDNSGKPQFADLLFHRGNSCFFVLDFCLRAKIRAMLWICQASLLSTNAAPYITAYGSHVRHGLKWYDII